MRVRPSVFFSAFLLALWTGSVSAGILTVRLTGHVDVVDDPGNALGGQVTMGQAVSGTYSYETTVTDQSTSPEYGSYPQTSWQGSIKMPIGSLTFASDPTSPNWIFGVMLTASLNYEDYFRISSGTNKPLANGSSVGLLDVDFIDVTGAAFSSDALPTGAPNLSSFSTRAVHISGTSPTGAWYYVRVQLDGTALEGPTPFVSPVSGNFIRGQQMRPALILPNGSQAASFTASANGIPLPPSYLAECRFVTLYSQNGQAVLCADILPLLGQGVNRMDWSVKLLDGSTMTDSVEWKLID